MPIALVRSLSPRLAECELTHLERSPIDVDRAIVQHEAYCGALARLGCSVQPLPATPDLPDGVFVEDPAHVVDEVAIIARSSALSRREETETMEAALREYRPIRRIETPGTLDGGDVFRLGRVVLVGLSARTNEAAVTQMREHLAPYGYAVHGIPVTGCLHLKSACTAVAADTIVVNRAWIDAARLRSAVPDATLIDVHPDEPRGANHLLVPADQNAVISPASCPRTVERLRERGITGEIVDVSELEKAESGVTCSSLILMRAPIART